MKAMSKTVKGFTLIELLIVVAIIAILAAIAVPNFLQAQVRSKVSRTHADMRTIATAIEEYTVDSNIPPMGRVALKPFYPQLSANDRDEVGLSFLTTPVAYITSIPRDVFGETLTDQNSKRRTCFVYVAFAYATGGLNKDALDMGYTWNIHTRGPSQKSCNALRTLLGQWDWTATNFQGIVTAQPYDSSNGTISQGVIIRTNKGMFGGKPGS